MNKHRIFAVSTATRGIGFVFMIDGELVDWGISRIANRSPRSAMFMLQDWIDLYKPSLVVTEKIALKSRKSKKAKKITKLFAQTAANNYVYDIAVPIVRTGMNKYAYALALVETYPVLKPRLPKSYKWYNPEPHNMLIFDALSLAHTILTTSTIDIAAGMDTPIDE